VGATSDNATGIAGVAWDSPILPVRVTDDEGLTTTRDLAAAILWAVNHGAKVINVSFAPLWSDRIVRAAAEHAFNRGAIVVISAGNGGSTIASLGYRSALFVGAVGASDDIAFFSDRGPFVDLVSPGVQIRSTGIHSDYQLVHGTSFAAPMVSGVAALAWSVNPELRPASIQAAILDTAIDLGRAGKDTTYGHGLVDAYAAVLEASRSDYTPDATPPTVSVDQPTEGSVFSRRFVAFATATDSPASEGVADVVLAIDGLPFATDTRAPYRFLIDPAAFSQGDHELAFVATDLTGNVSPTTTVTVTFNSGAGDSGLDSHAGIVFHSPNSGSSVSGTVTITATVTDEDGLATVEWLIDGSPVVAGAVSGGTSRVSYVWRTTGQAPGRQPITSVVTDAMGRQARGDLELLKG
jgi:thermitase